MGEETFRICIRQRSWTLDKECHRNHTPNLGHRLGPKGPPRFLANLKKYPRKLLAGVIHDHAARLKSFAIAADVLSNISKAYEAA